jgi:DNA-directed RNA polymerase alpha subunit
MKINVEFNSPDEIADFAQYFNQFSQAEVKSKQPESEDSWRWKFERTEANLERALHRIRILDPNGETANYEVTQPVKDPVDQLSLTNRTLNCLIAENITSVAQLCSYTSEDLLKINNLGKRSLRDIVDCLAVRKLKLKSSP